MYMSTAADTGLVYIRVVPLLGSGFYISCS